MSKNEISLIITVLNEEKTLESLFMALAKQTILPHETIIVDGGSIDGTYQLLQSFKTKYRTLNVQVLQVEGNRSRGRNAAIHRAEHELIAITDAGCIPQVDWLQKLRQKVIEYQLKNHFIEGLVVAGYYDAKPKTPFEEAVVPYVLVMPDQVNPHTFLPATRSMMLHRHVWEVVGGFDENLNDNEDYDFAKRIQKKAQEQNQSGYELPLEIIFAQEAKVTWIPRTNLSSFAYMIYRFARGDAQAGIWRPKVGVLFGRYLAATLLVLAGIALNQMLLFSLVAILVTTYILWSIKKNFRYATNGWYWLPVLQIVSDIEVIRGSLVGLIKRTFAYV